MGLQKYNGVQKRNKISEGRYVREFVVRAVIVESKQGFKRNVVDFEVREERLKPKKVFIGKKNFTHVSENSSKYFMQPISK